MGQGLCPEPTPGVENRHVEEEEETWLWDAGEQGGGKLWDRGKENPWDFLPSAPSSVKDCRYHGLPGPSSQPPVEQDAGEARGEGGLQGEGEHGGNIVSSSSSGQPLRSFHKSEWPLELLQKPSNAQEAIEHPTTRGCKCVPCPLHIPGWALPALSLTPGDAATPSSSAVHLAAHAGCAPSPPEAPPSQAALWDAQLTP